MADKEIDWNRLGKEIAQTQNGFAVLRLLEAHGITHFAQLGPNGIRKSCSLDVVLDYAHKER